MQLRAILARPTAIPSPGVRRCVPLRAPAVERLQLAPREAPLSNRAGTYVDESVAVSSDGGIAVAAAVLRCCAGSAGSMSKDLRCPPAITSPQLSSATRRELAARARATAATLRVWPGRVLTGSHGPQSSSDAAPLSISMSSQTQGLRWQILHTKPLGIGKRCGVETMMVGDCFLSASTLPSHPERTLGFCNSQFPNQKTEPHI